jgi:hypothetical protein
MLKKTILSVALIAAAGTFLSTPRTNASTVSFSSISVGDGSNHELGGSIEFAFGNGTVTVTITNSTTSTLSANELLGGVGFTLAVNGLGTPSIANTPTVGDQITVASDGTYTKSGATANNNLSGPWNASLTGSTILLMAGPSGATTPGPSDLVIGTPATGGTTYNGNGSIDGNSAHNPFLFETATFTLDISGVTASSSLDPSANVVVYYGTGGSTFSITPQGAVVTGGQLPIPATLPLVGAGMLGLGLLALRNRRRRTSKP